MTCDACSAVSDLDMTAAPELSETQTITHSRVESSLARPETRDQERFFMKTEAVAVEQSTG